MPAARGSKVDVELNEMAMAGDHNIANRHVPHQSSGDTAEGRRVRFVETAISI